MKIYTIRDWESFEHPTKDKRPQNGMDWWRHPGDLHSRGRLRLLRAGSDGRTALVVFDSLISLHAAQPKRRRSGRLVGSDGSPLEIEDIAAAISIEPELVAASLDLLASDRIGWITIEDGPRRNRTRTAPDPDRESLVTAPDSDRTRTDDGPDSDRDRSLGDEMRCEGRGGTRASAREAPPPPTPPAQEPETADPAERPPTADAGAVQAAFAAGIRLASGVGYDPADGDGDRWGVLAERLARDGIAVDRLAPAVETWVRTKKGRLRGGLRWFLDDYAEAMAGEARLAGDAASARALAATDRYRREEAAHPAVPCPEGSAIGAMLARAAANRGETAHA